MKRSLPVSPYRHHRYSLRRHASGAIVIKVLSLVFAALILIPLLVLGFYEGRKAYWDAQVTEMCAKDGGIKVYETVKLPADKFNEWGQINFYKPTRGENTIGPEYQFKRKTIYYRQGNPEVSRIHHQVIRRSDSKLLGDTVFYGGGGGDGPGPWHGSSFRCPDPVEGEPNALLKFIFIVDGGIK